MSDDEPLLSALVERVLHPLVCGSELTLVAPIGPKRAVEHARLAATLPDFSGEAANEVQWQRLRVARKWCAIDRLPPPSEGEWILLAALNDLLQVTNPDLPGFLAADRPLRLLELCEETIGAAGPARTVGEALFRHASFSRVLELVRVDTHVSWWTGSRTYRGARPPGRLLAWQSVRRVRRREEQIPLGAMVDDRHAWAAEWHRVFARWLAASPLTDLAYVLRPEPKFHWTGSTLGLIATAPGRTLARRVLLRSGEPRQIRAALDAASGTLHGSQPDAAQFAGGFSRELEP